MTIAMPPHYPVIRKHFHHPIRQQQKHQQNRQHLQAKKNERKEEAQQQQQQKLKTSDAFHIVEKYPETKLLMLVQSRTKDIKVNIKPLSERKIAVREKFLLLGKTKLYKGNRILVRARNIFSKGKT